MECIMNYMSSFYTHQTLINGIPRCAIIMKFSYIFPAFSHIKTTTLNMFFSFDIMKVY